MSPTSFALVASSAHYHHLHGDVPFCLPQPWIPCDFPFVPPTAPRCPDRGAPARLRCGRGRPTGRRAPEPDATLVDLAPARRHRHGVARDRPGHGDRAR